MKNRIGSALAVLAAILVAAAPAPASAADVTLVNGSIQSPWGLCEGLIQIVKTSVSYKAIAWPYCRSSSTQQPTWVWDMTMTRGSSSSNYSASGNLRWSSESRNWLLPRPTSTNLYPVSVTGPAAFNTGATLWACIRWFVPYPTLLSRTCIAVNI